MSLLALLLPARSRASALGETPAGARLTTAVEPPAEWRFVYSRQGLSVDREGRAAAADLPKADRVVLVVQDEDVAWLSATLPKASAKRLPEVLRGALEDQLLEDPASAHLALGPGGLREDGPTWVAALHLPWLERQLQALREQGLQADALVCPSEPATQLKAHARLGADGQALAVVCGPEGVAQWPLAWPGGRERLQAVPAWTAEPAAARLLAEQGHADARLQDAAHRALQAAQSGTNLLQLGLAPRMKGSRALWAAWATLKDRRYRALHVGLAALVLVQVVGLNLQAWRAHGEVQALRQQQQDILREAFPSIKVVVDPLLQAERELLKLRRAAGEPGPADLETALDVAAGAWALQPLPAGQLKSIRWDEQGLALLAAASTWPPEAVQRLQDHAGRLGWQTRQDGPTLRLVRPGAGAP